MGSKFEVRCAVLVVLISSIVSENVKFSSVSKFNTDNCTNNLDVRNGSYTSTHVSKIANLNRTFLKASEKTVKTFYPEKQDGKICSDENYHESIQLIKLSGEIDIKFQSKLSWTGDILFGSLLAVFSFLSLLGNSCALLIFLFRRSKLSSVEVFFINLAIVDILFSIASYPMSTAAAFRHRWDFGQIGCTIYGFICYFLGVASISSITSIALVRYFKTCNPIRGYQITCKTSCKIIALGYSIALFWAVVPIIGFGSYEVEPYGLSCTLNWMANNIASRIYIILVTTFVVFLPLFIIIFCYLQIICTVRRSNLKMKTNGINKRCTRRSDVQLTWISVLISTGFIVAWSPYAVCCLYSSFWGKHFVPIWATSVPTLLAKSAIVINPVIYIFFTAKYRRDLVSQIQSWFIRTKYSKKKRLCH